MKSYKFLQLAPVLALLFATACASNNPKPPEPKPMNQVDDSHCAPFNEGKSASLVIEYYRDDTIYMKRPMAREGGFLTIFSKKNIVSEVKRRIDKYDCAVVVLGYMYNPEQERALFKDWEGVMRECGFQRVVFLRTSRRYGAIDGLPVLHDSVIGGLNEPAKLAVRDN